MKISPVWAAALEALPPEIRRYRPALESLPSHAALAVVFAGLRAGLDNDAIGALLEEAVRFAEQKHFRCGSCFSWISKGRTTPALLMDIGRVELVALCPRCADRPLDELRSRLSYAMEAAR